VNGATTLYENWPIDAKSDISRNHIMFGEIGAWLFKGPGGIKPDETKPGFKNVILQPNFVNDLGFFEATHIGPFGKIISSWKKSRERIEYDVTIPANSTGTLILRLPSKTNLFENGSIVPGHSALPANPGSTGFTETSYLVKAGTHHFEIK